MNHQIASVARLRLRRGNRFDGWNRGPLWSIPAVRRAARAFELDEKRRGHRNLLLVVLADILFGEPRRAGRPRKPTKWNRAGLIRLRDDYNELLSGNPPISDKAAAEKIKEKFPDRYRHVQAGALRRRLPEARGMNDPAK